MESTGTEASDVVGAPWERMRARDRDGPAALFAEDAVVERPVGGERIVARDDHVAVDREHPGGWSIRVLRIVARDGEAVSGVEVPHEGVGTFRAVSLRTVRDGRIVRGTEYRTSPGSDPRPAWRTARTEAT
ncbi:nuclear transport factor 2 family protein [Streptomyces bikiniensis]|uniref:nuclear transport factor 2 family protein n=1 Tax=Streptomyces bikiniensis TaxID=1896 RepID=UPI0004C12CD2|nr:nuclear transport factor 2 family protein [Streptomyces bikiniensis]